MHERQIVEQLAITSRYFLLKMSPLLMSNYHSCANDKFRVTIAIF